MGKNPEFRLRIIRSGGKIVFESYDVLSKDKILNVLKQ